jgi:protein-S-isoprenylcysteine O-methyltransferase Ste14
MRNGRLAFIGVFLFLVLFFGLVIAGWGDLAGFFTHPARLGLVLVTIVLSILTLLSGANVSTGQREDVQNRWIFVPLTLVGLAFAYLPPYADRHNLFTVDGDWVRYLGLTLYLLGGGLRTWAIWALGPRFSALVAIQQNHHLETGGVYALIRHPSYTGAILALMGWTLVFRSLLVLILVPILVWIVIARIQAEERLLAAQFGQTYAEYRKRTWKLLPFVY